MGVDFISWERSLTKLNDDVDNYLLPKPEDQDDIKSEVIS